MEAKTKNKDYEKRVYEAVDLYNKKKFTEAKKKFHELAYINPENIKVHEVLCQIHTHEEDFPQAEKEYEIVCDLMRKKGIEIPPRRTFEEIADSLDSQEVLEERFHSSLKKSSSEALRDASHAVQLAIHHMKEGRYGEAEKVVKKYKEHCVK